MSGRRWFSVAAQAKSPIRISRVLARILAMSLSLLLAGQTSMAEDRPAVPDNRPLEFRRIYAPADRVGEWPRGNVQYVPIEPEEFERLLEAVRSAPGGVRASAGARLAHAHYGAQFAAPDRLIGQARLEIVHPARANALLTLDPFGLAVEQARWEDPAAAAPTWGLNAREKLAVLVERPGNLLLDWSLRGHLDSRGGVEFSLELPQAPYSSMLLDLPAGLAPVAPGGVVAEQTPQGDLQRWRIEFGGQSHQTLRLAPRQPGGEERRLVLSQEQYTYDFSARGLDLVAQYKLSAHDGPLTRLEVLLDPGLQLAAARYGDSKLPWSVLEGVPGGVTRVLLEFAEPLVGPGRVLRLTAIAPLVTDRRFKLPTIRPQGLFWQEGSATLVTPAPLSLDELAPEGCRQSRVGSLPAPLVGELIELQYFSPDASISVRLSRRQAALLASTAVQAVLDPAGIDAQFVGEFRQAEGERFKLEADVAEGWRIDDVRATPSAAILSWQVEAADSPRRVLSVRLAQALAADSPVKLHVTARSPVSPLGRALRPDDLQPLTFRSVQGSQRLLAVRPAAGYQVGLQGANEAPRLDPRKLTPDQQSLFAEAPRDLVFDLQPASGGWSVVLEKQPARYAGEVRAEATVSAGPLVESYAIACQPDASQIERVIVHFTQARSEPPHWSMGGEARSQFIARLWTGEEQDAAGLGTVGETWEIKLRRPRSAPFELLCSRPTELKGATPLSLIALPEASSQQGSLVVGAVGATPVQIVNARLKPAAAAAAPLGQYSAARASFRYDPTLEVGPAATAAITVLRPQSERQPPGAVVWSCELDSHFDAFGGGTHLVTWRLQSQGLATCELSAPTGVALQGLWVDEVSQSLADGSHQRVTLPAGSAFPTVTAQFVSPAADWGLTGRAHIAAPRLDIPVLAQSWTFWLPPDYAPGDCMPAERPSWSQRLLGPLGRSTDQPRFDPVVELGSWRTGAGRNAPRADGAALPAPAARLPWRAQGPGSSRAGDYAGWLGATREMTAGAPLTIWVVRRSAIKVATWSALALSLAIGLWLSRRPGWLLLICGILAFAALVVPAACAPLAAGGLIGALVSLALRFSLAAQRPHPEPKSGQTRSLAVASGVLAVIAWCCLADGSAAQAPIHRVFIPVDADRNPSGRYQVPEEFNDELRRRATLATDEPQGWLLQAADYRATIALGVGESRLEISSMTARYDVQTFAPGMRVRIPLARENANLVADAALLDGRPVELDWEQGGQALLCQMADAGLARLELTLRPVIHTSGETSGFELSIPRLASSALQLDVPAGERGVEVPGAVGSLAWSEDGQRLAARLGPTDRLAVRWPQRAGGNAPQMEVEELLWLKVRPGAVVLDALFKYKFSGSPARRLQLAIDPRLRLMPPEGADSPVSMVRALPSASGSAESLETVELELKRPAQDTLSLRLSLLLTETSGVGKLRLPRLAALGAKSTRRWLAVSVEPGLEFEAQRDADLESLALGEFSTAWGPPDPQPLLAYRLAAGEPSWSLATRRREPRTTARQTVALSFERGGAEVRLDAELQTDGGFVFQHRLLAPSALEIRSVSLSDEGGERSARWARDDAGGVTVFLSGPTTGHQQLALRGRLPTPLVGKYPLGGLSVTNADVTADRLLVYRAPAVLVELEDLTGFVPAAENVRDELPAEFGRQVAALDSTSRDAAATAAITLNEPAIEAVQLASMRYQDEAWEAEVDCRLRIAGGVLDTLRLEIPASWKGPFAVTPPASAEIVQLPQDNRRQLVLRPRAAVTGEYRLVIRGPLELTAGQGVSAPDILPLEVQSLERYWLLPTQTGLQQVTWETARLTRAPLPAGFAAPNVGPEAFEVYRALGDRPQATLQLVERTSDSPVVRLADIRLAWQPDGACRLAAAFDLAPAGLAQCPLQLPAGWHLAQLTVAGLPVTPRWVAASDWEIPLGPERLPQRIEVLATGPLANRGSAWSEQALPTVRLGNLPVERALWSVTAPAGFASVEPGAGASTIDGAAYALFRAQSAGAQLDLPAEVLATTRPSELANWYRTWARLVWSCRTELSDRLAAADGAAAARSTEEEVRKLDVALNASARRLDASQILEQLRSERGWSGQGMDLWEQMGDGGIAATRYLVPRGADVPRARRLPILADDVIQRLLLASGLLLMALAAAWTARRGQPWDALRRWPHAWGVALGLAWWLWLSPSALGWVLVIASLVLSVVGGRRRPRENGSTVAPLNSLYS